MIINTLATIAICYLICSSPLLESPREWIANRHKLLAEIIYCNICLSFWIGIYLTQSITQAFAIMGVMVLVTTYENKIT